MKRILLVMACCVLAVQYADVNAQISDAMRKLNTAVFAVIVAEHVENLCGLLRRCAFGNGAVDQLFDAVTDHHSDLVQALNLYIGRGDS